MARPANVTRVVISGTSPAGESFAWGFWLNAGQGSLVATQATATAISTAFSANAAAQLRGLILATSSYTLVTVYSYETAAPAATYVAEAPISPGTGTGTDPAMPLQVAWAVTIRTAIAGRQYRGRLYLPVSSMLLTAHQVTQSQTSAVMNAVRGFLAAVNGSATVVGSVCVVSVVGGVATQATAITVDSRLDIQRRRAAEQTPLYSESSAV